MKIIKYGILGVILALTGTFSSEVLAQDNTETERIEALRDMVKSESLNLSMLIHSRGVFSFNENGTRTLTVPNARLKVDGKLDGGFSYNLQFDATSDNILLDAIIAYAINERTNFAVGAQKPGISYEFLTAPHKLDFVTRSFIVTALAQNRELGARLSGDFSNEFNYSVGIFNGNRLGANDNNKFYYVGRLGYNSSSEDGSLVVGVNAAYGEQSNAQLSAGILPNIDGERFIYGGDLRFENATFIFASEVLAADLDYIGFTEQDNVFGVHVTGGYKLSERSRVLLRFENLDSELLGPFVNQERLVFGFSHFPTKQTGFRINYNLPLDNTDFSNHGLALSYYIAF
jgi:hypothetical protein